MQETHKIDAETMWKGHEKQYRTYWLLRSCLERFKLINCNYSYLRFVGLYLLIKLIRTLLYVTTLTVLHLICQRIIFGDKRKWRKTLCNSRKSSLNHSKPLTRRSVQELRLTLAYPAGHHNNKPDYREPTVFVKANVSWYNHRTNWFSKRAVFSKWNRLW